MKKLVIVYVELWAGCPRTLRTYLVSIHRTIPNCHLPLEVEFVILYPIACACKRLNIIEYHVACVVIKLKEMKVMLGHASKP